MQHYNDTLSYSTLVLDLPHASSSVAIVLSFPTDCALSGVVLSRPGPEALRPYIGQARPTYRAYVLQSFFLIIQSYFSFILIVYLLGEVDIVTPTLLCFSFAPHLLSLSLTFLWT